MAVLGVDACKGHWVGVLLSDDRGWIAAETRPRINELVTTLAATARTRDTQIRVVAVDIPVGLPDAGRRPVDELAKKKLAARSASVFLTPTRGAIEEPDYAIASAIQRRLTGDGLSRQAHALRERILDVDSWLAGSPSVPVIEIHPELSFAAMLGHPAQFAKKTWAGAHLRRRALAEHGINIPDEIGAAGARAGIDDILDAAAAAWTASRYPADAHPIPSADAAWKIWA